MNGQEEFYKYVYWLGENIPKHMQEQAHHFFINKCKEEAIPYIICTSNPFTWANAIDIIKEIGYPKNKLATERIMYLFQDINWKFAKTALSVVNDIYNHEPDIVVKAIEKNARLADKYCDTDWLFGLSWVKENLKISKNDFQNIETLAFLFKGEYWDDLDEIE